MSALPQKHQYRRVATRYGNFAANYLAFVQLVDRVMVAR
jgi:hypothetical protein